MWPQRQGIHVGYMHPAQQLSKATLLQVQSQVPQAGDLGLCTPPHPVEGSLTPASFEHKLSLSPHPTMGTLQG